ncbi:methyltransferase [Dokdonia pacifica]|uniref:Methyltransferase domain-containing protein n=1 Tax=Dokdonia pacifica TaxID=1627892 RepID=A0A238ZNM9_9FLAO|nr:class I SAM-dependent methyltransferase [Dokdonia pacifica]GGG07573.1 methyltransferase [Dokdonia pacifica]SNR84779.1 Methyltransferase domain-containing protein [Dokdonia pacifica]
MSKEKIKQAYEQLATAYSNLIDHKPHNAYYDRPNTLALLGNVKGKNILDAACGPGKYAEILIDQGAEVVGMDISEQMIYHAKERNPSKGRFFVHDLEQPLSMLENDSFDTVLCALAMHYLEDWNHTLQEFYRVLKPNGQLVLSIEHPFFEYTYFKSKEYFDVEPVSCTWNGFGMPVKIHSYRRSLQDCINPLLNNGFMLDTLLEPKPVAAFEALDPKHFKELNEFPAFMHIRAIKK